MTERIIHNILRETAGHERALSDMHFGLRKPFSTVDAIKVVVDTAITAIEGERWQWEPKQYCAVVTLDAFN